MVPYVPVYPGADPSSSDSSLLESSNSSDSGYFKQARRTRKNVGGKGVTMTIFKSAPISHPIYLRLSTIIRLQS